MTHETFAAFFFGALFGVVATIIIVGLINHAARENAERICMERNKAPACERVVQWYPLRRSEP